jgi:hypothetical protein
MVHLLAKNQTGVLWHIKLLLIILEGYFTDTCPLISSSRDFVANKFKQL